MVLSVGMGIGSVLKQVSPLYSHGPRLVSAGELITKFVDAIRRFQPLGGLCSYYYYASN